MIRSKNNGRSASTTDGNPRSLGCLGFPKYEILDDCRVRNIATKKYLKTCNLEKNEYVNLKFSLGNKQCKSMLAHVVIAKMFIPNPDPSKYKTVDHINRMRGDNRIENLRWATAQMQNDNKSNNKRVRGRRVCQFDSNYVEIKRWNSIAELRRHYKCDIKTIKKWIASQILIEHKYYFQFVDVVDANLYPDEEWRENTSHPDIPKKIFVSNYGRIKEENGILHEPVERGGYDRVSFSRGDGTGYEYSVHRFVAEAFCEQIKGKDVVNHKDGNKKNNRAENLEYTDPKGNNQHSVNTGLRTYDKQCRPVERLSGDGTIKRYKSMEAAALELRNTSNPKAQRSTITRACNHNYYAYGYKWRYCEKLSEENSNDESNEESKNFNNPNEANVSHHSDESNVEKSENSDDVSHDSHELDKSDESNESKNLVTKSVDSAPNYRKKRTLTTKSKINLSFLSDLSAMKFNKLIIVNEV